MTDIEFKQLKQDEEAAWKEYKQLEAQAEPAKERWLALHRKREREAVKREVLAEQAAECPRP